MKTSVIEVRDMLSVLSVAGVEERIGDVPGFVVAYGGASRSVVHGNAFDTRHIANPLFQAGHA